MANVTCPECGHKFQTGKHLNLDGFDEFWSVYPRKIGKGQARLAYARALAKTDKATILACAKRYAGECKLREPQYIRLPATWLNGEGWEDGGNPVSGPLHDAHAPPRSVPPSWRVHYAALTLLISEAHFQTWLGESELELAAGQPARIKVKSIFVRDWLVSHFAGPLFKVLGDFEIVIKER